MLRKYTGFLYGIAGVIVMITLFKISEVSANDGGKCDTRPRPGDCCEG
jgi:hypothetical protein